ncbi:MAG: response regulator [Myxococcota bacterium]|nr:response regulator [Myxococcota bacterium]
MSQELPHNLPGATLEGKAVPRRVLIVDDDRDAVRIIGDLLESRGYNAVVAMDGHEALARFHDEGPFDVIILDVMMPNIDGLEVCRRLKSSPQGMLTPILLISARTDTRSRIAGLYAGADDYMSKPVDLREFGARVDVLLRLHDRYVELTGRRTEALDAATVDGLSGALSGAYFRRRLDEEIQRADRYNYSITVLLMDLQGLPEPAEGGLEADWSEERFASPVHRLVRVTGIRLRAGVRAPDLLARLHRGRFALMLPHTSKKSVMEAIARLKELVASIPASGDSDPETSAGLSLRVGYAELGPRMNAESLLVLAEPS